jgi:hypothetical protein
MSSLTSVDFAPEMGAYRKGANAALEGVRPAFVSFFCEALGLLDCVSYGALPRRARLAYFVRLAAARIVAAKRIAYSAARPFESSSGNRSGEDSIYSAIDAEPGYNSLNPLQGIDATPGGLRMLVDDVLKKLEARGCPSPKSSP